MVRREANESPRGERETREERVRVAQPIVGRAEVEAAERVILSGRYVSGSHVREFEERFAEYLSVGHAVAVNSGTAALHLALSAAGIGWNDEVIVPPLTFFATVSSVLHAHAIPVFADVDPTSFCLDPRDVERRITPRTRAIVAVHLYGDVADLPGLRELARTHGIHLIEDCAQAHGSELKGQKVGSWGDAGIFSFYATKHMTTGEGGMLVTDRADWAATARRLRNHGLDGRNQHMVLGYNYRMNEISAAIGLAQLERLEPTNQRRIEVSMELLSKLRERDLDWLTLPKLRSDVRHTFFWLPVRVHEERLGRTAEELVAWLSSQGIETRHRYWEPLYRQPVLLQRHHQHHRMNFAEHDVDYENLFLPRAEELAAQLIGLPNHAGLESRDLDIVVETLARAQVTS